MIYGCTGYLFSKIGSLIGTSDTKYGKNMDFFHFFVFRIPVNTGNFRYVLRTSPVRSTRMLLDRTRKALVKRPDTYSRIRSENIPQEHSEDIPLKRSHNVPLKRSQDVPLKRSGNVPLKCSEDIPQERSEVIPKAALRTYRKNAPRKYCKDAPRTWRTVCLTRNSSDNFSLMPGLFSIKTKFRIEITHP